MLTKVDGDARGGAALSIRHITGKPIKFLGVGEKPKRWSRSIRTASLPVSSAWATCCRLIEDIESKVDRAQAEKLASSREKGDGLIRTGLPGAVGRSDLKTWGGMASLDTGQEKLPGMGQIPDKRQSADG